MPNIAPVDAELTLTIELTVLRSDLVMDAAWKNLKQTASPKDWASMVPKDTADAAGILVQSALAEVLDSELFLLHTSSAEGKEMSDSPWKEYHPKRDE